MAAEDLNLDVEPEKKSSKLMLIIIGVVVLVLIGGGVAFFLMSGDDADAPPPVEVVEPAIYLPIRPAFVVNFANTSGQTNFLQLEITLMGRNPEHMKSLEDHMPLIKSRLINVFQTQEFEELRTPEGKEAMRRVALDELQNMALEELGDPIIEKLYFTIFVLQ